MTRDELVAMAVAAFDAEMALLADRIAVEVAGITDPQEIEQTIRIETRRAIAGLRKRTDKLLGEAAFDSAQPGSLIDIN
jgi:hypothetical protein